MLAFTRARYVALYLCSFAPSAWPACAPDPVANGQHVVCDGQDFDDLVAAPGVTDVVVDIQSGAGAGVTSSALLAPDIALGVNDRSRITNAGSVLIDGAAQARAIAVDVRGNDVTLVNTGTVSPTLSDTDLIAHPGRDDHALHAIAIGETAAAAAISVDLRGDVSVVHRGSGEAAALLIGDAAQGVNVTLGTADAVTFMTLQVAHLGGLTDAVGNTLVPIFSPGPGGELLATNPLTGTVREYDVSGAIVARAGAGPMTIVNRAAAIVSNDFFSPALYLLAPRVSVTTTDGFIGNNGAVPVNFQPGIALASSGAGRVDIDLRNTSSSAWSGEIVIGDVNPIRWWAQERLGVTGLDLAANQTGIRDSSVQSVHAIFGNVYLGSGRHVWRFSPLEADGVIGNVSVDQRNLSGSATLGARQFDFAGAMLTGGLEIRDVPGAHNIVTLYPGGSIGPLSATSNDGDNEVRLAAFSSPNQPRWTMAHVWKWAERSIRRASNCGRQLRCSAAASSAATCLCTVPR